MFRVLPTITEVRGHVHTAGCLSSQCLILVIQSLFLGDFYYLNNDKHDKMNEKSLNNYRAHPAVARFGNKFTL